MDGTIPRARLPEVLDRMNGMSAHYGLRVANVFHAGDGNLHPLILYDANVPGELERAEEFGADILKLCVEVGGVLTGEHGVGVEKRDLMGEMFSEDDLKQQQRVKCAFDPDQLLNPGKVFPNSTAAPNLAGSTFMAARRASRTCRGSSRDFSRGRDIGNPSMPRSFERYRHSAPDRPDPILPPLQRGTWPSRSEVDGGALRGRPRRLRGEARLATRHRHLTSPSEEGEEPAVVICRPIRQSARYPDRQS